SDGGGVVLNIRNAAALTAEFERMMNIKDTTAVLLQPMLSGIELFAGAKREDHFGHLILAGMGGIFIEVLKDVAARLSPLSAEEASEMINSLKSQAILKGVRGQKGINREQFIDVLLRLSALQEAAPEIFEMDLNPLLGNEKQIVAVDARIHISKQQLINDPTNQPRS
ncbi:MAG: acetate--CoA ligase family protein, partial [Bacteroidales bacterium]|nr:acetate--CoA ligase family protein [Bacteroidales bacterium]